MAEVRTGIRLEGDASGYVAATTQAAQAAARQAEAEKVLQEGMRRTTLSAGEWKNAMRTLPAQLTDIFTGLASGQAPMTVAIQQGGQLRDQFGGFSNIMKGVASVVTPTALAIGGLAATAGVLYLAAKQVNDEKRAFVLALAESGNAAGTSRSRMADYSREVSQAAGTTHAAAEAIAQLTSTGRVMSADLPRFATIALQAQRLLGREVGDTVQMFAALGKDPVTASLKLNESTNYLTASVLKQIQAQEALGNTQAAASLAQNEWARNQERVLAEAKKSLGGLESAWHTVGGAAKQAWDWMLGLGREETFEQRIARARAALESKPWFDLRSDAQRAAQTGDLQASIATDQESQRLADRAARERAAAVQSEQESLLKLSAGYQQAQIALSKAAQDLQLANIKAALQAGRELLKTAFQRDEVLARDYQESMLAIDLAGYDAQLRALDAAIAAQRTRVLKLDSPEALARNAAVSSLLAGRQGVVDQRSARLAGEERGDFDVTPKSRTLPRDVLRAALAADAAQAEADNVKEIIQRTNDEILEGQQRHYDGMLNASQEYIERLQPQWQKTVDGWGSSFKQMRDAYDRTITAGLQAGEQAWINFAKTGKLSVKSIVDAMETEVARYAFRQFMSLGLNLFSVGGGLSNTPFKEPGVGNATPQGAVDGRVSIASAGRSSAAVTIINQSGTPLAGTASVGSDGSIEVLLTAAESFIADRLGAGVGPVAAAVSGRFGLRTSFSS